MDEILVSGGSGFSGSHCVYRLVSSGKRVRLLSRMADPMKEMGRYLGIYPDWQDVMQGRVQLFRGDILDPVVCMDAADGVSGIIHYAGMVGFDGASKEKLIAVNAGGTANLVNAALETGVCRFTHIGSIASLGRSADGNAVNEASEWSRQKRTSAYGFSKLLAEREFWRGIAEGLQGVTVYPSVILGPGNPVLRKSIITGLLGMKHPFYPPGSGSFVDVRDLAEAVIQLHFSEIRERGYIVSGFNVSFRELLTAAAGITGLRSPERMIRKNHLAVMAAIKTLFPFFRSLPGREMVRILCSRNDYDSSRLVLETGFRFRPMHETLELMLRS